MITTDRVIKGPTPLPPSNWANIAVAGQREETLWQVIQRLDGKPQVKALAKSLTESIHNIVSLLSFVGLVEKGL